MKPMRNGSFRLDMPAPHPQEPRVVAWLRAMVEDRRARGVAPEGHVFPDELNFHRRQLRSHPVTTDPR